MTDHEGWAESIPKLKEPLRREHVSQRQQAGISLSYIEGWHAIDEMNRIFGHDGWTKETIVMDLLSEQERKLRSGKDAVGVTYYAKVRVVALGVVREGCGCGHGIDQSRGQAHESAIKEAETDAFKRAVMSFGYPLGLALYDKKQEHVTSD